MVQAESPRRFSEQVFDSIRRIGYRRRDGSVIVSRLARLCIDLRYRHRYSPDAEVRALGVQGEQKQQRRSAINRRVRCRFGG
jgi:hypothetical protein